jgi:Holliday junction DNA helicase RuvA
MISRLRGRLIRRDLTAIEVMTASGVAYEVVVPLTVFEKLPREGADVELRTQQVFREDGVTLYGFLESAERAVFARLLTASGVGPRLALNMLSTMTPHRLIRAILEKDVAALRQIPGLGTKKAERLVVELADRLDDLSVQAVGPPRLASRGAEEAVSALVALGYSPADAAAAVRKALESDTTLTGAEQVIRAALGTMAG